MSKHKISRKCGNEYDHNIALNGFCSFNRDFRKNRDDYCNIIGLSVDCPQDYEKCPHKTDELKDCM